MDIQGQMANTLEGLPMEGRTKGVGMKYEGGK